MKSKNLITHITIWVNRFVGLVVFSLIFFLPALIDWFSQYRVLTQVERATVAVCFYCCVVFIAVALWSMDRLLAQILQGEVFTRANVRRIRIIQWCCAAVSLICVPASFAYLPLVFLALIMAFLSLTVCVVVRVMDAAVSIREENDLTV